MCPGFWVHITRGRFFWHKTRGRFFWHKTRGRFYCLIARNLTGDGSVVISAAMPRGGFSWLHRLPLPSPLAFSPWEAPPPGPWMRPPHKTILFRSSIADVHGLRKGPLKFYGPAAPCPGFADCFWF